MFYTHISSLIPNVWYLFWRIYEKKISHTKSGRSNHMLLSKQTEHCNTDKYLASPPDDVSLAEEIYYRVEHSRRCQLSKFQSKFGWTNFNVGRTSIFDEQRPFALKMITTEEIVTKIYDLVTTDLRLKVG